MSKPTKRSILLSALVAASLNTPTAAFADSTHGIKSNQIVFDDTGVRLSPLSPVDIEFATGLANLIESQGCEGNYGSFIQTDQSLGPQSLPSALTIDKSYEGLGKHRTSTTTISAFNTNGLVSAYALWKGLSGTFDGYESCNDTAELFSIGLHTDVTTVNTNNGTVYTVNMRGVPTTKVNEAFIARDINGAVVYTSALGLETATNVELVNGFKQHLAETRGKQTIIPNGDAFTATYDTTQLERIFPKLYANSNTELLAAVDIVEKPNSNPSSVVAKQLLAKDTAPAQNTAVNSPIPKTLAIQSTPAKEIPEGYFIAEYNPEDMETDHIWHLYDNLALGTDWLNVESANTGAWNNGMSNTNFVGEDNSIYADLANVHELRGKTHLGASNFSSWSEVIRTNIEFNGYHQTKVEMDKLVREGFASGDATLLLPVKFEDAYHVALAAKNNPTPTVVVENDNDSITPSPFTPNDVSIDRVVAIKPVARVVNLANLVPATVASRNEGDISTKVSSPQYASVPNASNLSQFGDEVYSTFRAGAEAFDNPTTRIYQDTMLVGALTKDEHQALRDYQGLQAVIDFADIVNTANTNGDYARIKSSMQNVGDNLGIGGTTASKRLMVAAKELGFKSQSASMLREEILSTGIENTQNMAYHALTTNGTHEQPVYQLTKKF
ncbi:hypothetical protein HOA92_01930 [archaeon]|nr:hypothetical protein [archaeon]MBT6761773.1 hypothetical protein [archaeon]